MLQQPFKTISIGIAFSPSLRPNLAEALRLAYYLDSQLILVHVGEKNAEKKGIINNLIAEFSQDKQQTRLIWETGDPVEVINKACKNNQVDLLILGALRQEGFVKYYVGSIARKLTRKACCSVLLLINPSEKRVPCQHIVVNGLDGPNSTNTVTTSFQVAHALGTNKMTIVEEISQNEVHVNVSDDRSLRKATLVKERLKLREVSRVNKIVSDIPDEVKADINIQNQSIFGRRGYSIGHYARVVRADLLIMNAPDKTSFLDRFFPSDIEYILSELPTDVLILHS
jgi:nucleotide-binding universal stress UspA family protein